MKVSTPSLEHLLYLYKLNISHSTPGIYLANREECCVLQMASTKILPAALFTISPNWTESECGTNRSQHMHLVKYYTAMNKNN